MDAGLARLRGIHFGRGALRLYDAHPGWVVLGREAEEAEVIGRGRDLWRQRESFEG